MCSALFLTAPFLLHNLKKTAQANKKGVFIMTGIISCIIAGAAMSVQGVMNTRLGTVSAEVDLSDIASIGETSAVYRFGGVLGILITITVMIGMKNTSPAIAVSIILIAQLLVAAVIDAFGIMGTEKVPFLWNKYVGLALMIGGMLLFKLK